MYLKCIVLMRLARDYTVRYALTWVKASLGEPAKQTLTQKFGSIQTLGIELHRVGLNWSTISALLAS